MELYTDISSRCQALRADMTFRNIFELTCSQPERIAAHWLEGDEERSATFGDYRRMAMNYAQTLRSKLGANPVLDRIGEGGRGNKAND